MLLCPVDNSINIKYVIRKVSYSYECKKLFLIGGSSGTGKTAICDAIAGKVDKLVVVDGDVIWSCGNFTSDKKEGFYEFSLRLYENIARSGVSVAIFHAGMGLPENIMNCEGRKLFSEMFFLGLTCSDEEQEKRLKMRPEWQNSDATGISLEESSQRVIDWITEKL